MTIKLPVAALIATACMFVIPVAPAYAQAGICTAQCGGQPGGEAANTPKVVACYRKCMANNNTGASGRRGKN
jgi:hypothetical protein